MNLKDDGKIMRTRRYVITAVAFLTAACGGGRSSEGGQAATAQSCAPQDGILSHTFNVASLAGDYRLTLVATAGDSVGKSVEGQLRLMPHADSLKQLSVLGGPATVGTPLYGTAEIALARVNALDLGGLSSSDPMKPGAIMIERHIDAGLEVIMRLGSQANQRNLVNFDGGYTALTLRWAEGGAFGGSWASGMMGPQAGGHFCAVRQTG